jgi:hypothetical protein
MHPALAEPDAARAAALILEATNRFRASQGASRVEPQAQLAATARDFAAFMAKSGKFGHEADGSEPTQRTRRHGYDYCMVAENIGYEYRSQGFKSDAELAESFVEGWKRSPGHRKNLEDREATQIGVGVVRGQAGRYYAVQVFGRPASLRIKFEVVNESPRRIDYRVGTEGYSLPPRSTRTHEICGNETVTVHGQRIAPKNGARIDASGA